MKWKENIIKRVLPTAKSKSYVNYYSGYLIPYVVDMLGRISLLTKTVSSSLKNSVKVKQMRINTDQERKSYIQEFLNKITNTEEVVDYQWINGNLSRFKYRQPFFAKFQNA